MASIHNNPESADTDAHSVDARREVRGKLEHDIEDFLAHGGHVQEISAGKSADPPKKPQSNYGSQPI